MTTTIGIRREDKSRWERRAPLTPADLAGLRERHGYRFLVQPSEIRAFSDADYRVAGAEVTEDLGPASLVVAIKEIPVELLAAGKTYVFFAHVIKGQPHNMPMLARLLELGCSLVDYEKIVDERNRRLIFFGAHAGWAGMIETIWCLDRRLRARDLPSPFTEVRHAFEYRDLQEAKDHLRGIGRQIREQGLDPRLDPLVFGVAGYGNVAGGCQEILDCLEAVEVDVAELPQRAARGKQQGGPLLRVTFKEEHMVERREPGPPFALQEYYEHPERYRGRFQQHLPHLDVLVNATYWDKRYPRMVTREWARAEYGRDEAPRLQVIGDISCDLEGGIELTARASEPDAPCYTYDPKSDTVRPGCEGPGPVIMAVDNLPCELPLESSEYFSRALRDMVPALAGADWRAERERLDLPPHLRRALIVHRGELTPDFEYLRDHLAEQRASEPRRKP